MGRIEFLEYFLLNWYRAKKCDDKCGDQGILMKQTRRYKRRYKKVVNEEDFEKLKEMQIFLY